ncbi:hypothetical protein COT47_06155 [Candidatus Woesearchaeota archaeon CG08_land_8_20_14_0_20_43_7]|nr:MAG: hypothetical protein COT47_06155 [Candidatus Woesearchaeota archaeon CG08_land_8_20_14_0_20_43_7]
MLKNKTKQRIIITKKEIITNILGKAIGLMFRTKVEKALIFVNSRESYTPLHMFFVFCPIDVLYLNSEKKVVELKENFFPFTVFHPRKMARYII